MKFPYDIKLEDTWFEYDYNNFQNVLKTYREQRRILDNIEHEDNVPVPCKSWVECYHEGATPSYQAKMWTEIDNYIKEQEKKEGWVFDGLETEEVDVNTDPFYDYNLLTTKYTVCAIVKNEEDFRNTEEYLKQEEYVQNLYDELMELKKDIDKKLCGEKQ